MDFTTLEFIQFVYGHLGSGITAGTYAEGDEGFHQIKAEGLFIQHLGFEISNRIDNIRWEQFNLVRNFG